MAKRTVTRTAQLFAEAVAVACPHCLDLQPNRNGSEMWTLAEIEAIQGTPDLHCVSCELPFKLVLHSKVRTR